MLGFGPISAQPNGAGTDVSFAAILASPTQGEALTALRAFLETLMTIPIVLGQDNRVPEPTVSDYVVMTPIRRERLATNESSLSDCTFVGVISGAIMTVDLVEGGPITVGVEVTAPGVLPGTTVTAEITSDGDRGTYAVSPPQIVSQTRMSAGRRVVAQQTRIVVQVDLHGASGGDVAQVVTTALRDPYAGEWFAANHPNVSALYAEEPRQVPFLNAEQQYEDRWAVEVHLQVNPTVAFPQQFADRLKVLAASVEAVYPARSA